MSSHFRKSNMSNKSLQPPLHPIAIRAEHIAQRETARNDADGSTLFTVTGTKFGDRSAREFRDRSDLPLFELRRALALRRPLRVRLPGNDKEELVEVNPKRPLGNFDLTLRNAAATDAKNEADRTVTLEVHQTSPAFWLTFEVMAGDRQVVDVRESVQKNKTIGTLPHEWPRLPPPRQVLDVRVAEGSICRWRRWLR
ncbi:Uncharacterized protein T310_7802 [Rasamsonia emersonii CBS 393.64]|uniref:Uncharacterized protein n=1 Tax=Rasamsonia emersonii (strain ATCC 16479 / CBS 393.64 / IMI 116815) TaxID=1408163 RepID=A0A0F4YK65_RASE3|nr:Uncharacterized protein T310_7802 [Rasamsonia emersonii CBS 393.64]KKA18256.1 Uncharacterized protein T310_7802 [Rasamsonia emersonii CBS 393.64]